MHKSINNLVSIKTELKAKLHNFDKIKIIAVSKTFAPDKILPLINHGHIHFGENKVQEAVEKWTNIKRDFSKIKLHMIGKLQTNKVKAALDLFSVFHTLDREKLVRELIKFPQKLSNKSFFIQVNTGNEETKSGIKPSETKEFLEMCRSKGINNILGLMCIPPINEDPKKHFQLISGLSNDLGLGETSMGMSSDYLDALKFNPQYIRLGTVLFGKRA